MKSLFFLFIFNSLLYSSSLADLSKNKTWLELLHYNSNKSTIISKEFFLSTSGSTNPEEELKETLKFFKKIKNVCKYPARYIFLSKNIKSLNKVNILKECKELTNWDIYKNTNSISLFFVSSYLGNPASAFGHSFLKMNKSTKNKTNSLFDITISYGAKVPKNENILVYVFKGLTGLYKANYSDKYFYMDNMVYTNRENREMWEYKLKLSDEEKKLLLFHLWELKKAKFNYYFLNANCGYKISELLNLVYEKPLITGTYSWYAPIETFYKLDEFNAINKVIYHPSQQQKIYAMYNNLNKHEKKIVKKMYLQNKKSISENDENISKLSKVKIMDFLLDFQKYTFKKIDYKTLSERLKLPILNYSEAKINQKAPVTNRDKLSSFGFSANISQEKIHIYTSGFFINKVGYNDLYGDMFSIGDSDISITSKKITIEKLDIIKLRRLKTKKLPFGEENPLSWNLAVGTEKDYNRNYYFDAGIGHSLEFFKNHKFYMMLNGSLNSIKSNIRIRPNIGLFINFNKLKLNLELSIMYDEKLNYSYMYHDIEVQYSYKKDKSVFITYENKYADNLKIGLKWFY